MKTNTKTLKAQERTLEVQKMKMNRQINDSETTINYRTMEEQKNNGQRKSNKSIVLWKQRRERKTIIISTKFELICLLKGISMKSKVVKVGFFISFSAFLHRRGSECDRF